MDYILQLSLNKLRKSDRRDRAVQAVWLIDQLLEVIAENLSDENVDRNSFRIKLETNRRAILESDESAIPGSIAYNVLTLCRGQFKQLQTHRQERDEHFADIVQVLKDALNDLTGESRAFHEDLTRTIDCVGELLAAKGIEEEKSRIAKELKVIKRITAEKKEHEQTQFAQLADRITVLQHKLQTARAEAFVDGLTGIANRRNFNFTIQRWIIAHEKSEEPFTLTIIDIDDFKHVNNHYGHRIGDRVLVEVSMELGKNIRTKDYLARFAGDTFVILSTGMKLMESEKRFSGLLTRIEKMKFNGQNAGSDAVSFSVNASCGIAEYVFGEKTADLIKRAEEALNEAKQAGKSRVAVKRRPFLSAFYDGRKRNSIA